MPNRVAFNLDYPRIAESDALHARAIGLIPAATQTLAKGPGQYVNGVAPKYLRRGKGCRVWDVDGNEYLDFNMAIGPLSLGYAYPAVDEAIRAQLQDGITFSQMHLFEVEVAERVRELVPCAEMVRFSKTGCDVTSAAVRLARAFTGRRKVLCCGYHGWHDWYISVTDRSGGVPSDVKDLTFTFNYNDMESVVDGLDDDTACVILEPVAFEAPRDSFLHQLRNVCDERGIVLVFDEMWTGFRVDLGGAQARYGVTADLACFSKAVANGMPPSVLRKAHARGLVSAGDWERIAPILPPPGLKPYGLADLPEQVARPFSEKDGTRGRVLFIEPTAGRDDSDLHYLLQWTDAFRETALPSGEKIRGSGRAVVFADMLQSIMADMPAVLSASLLLTLMAVVVTFRRGRLSLLVLGALLTGAIWLLALLQVLHVKINFINFVALPVTFGIGVDYALNVVQRYGTGEGVRSAIRNAGAAVALCSLTTILSYLALLGSINQAVRSLGLVAVLGELCCLAAAVLVLPAALLLRERRASRYALPWDEVVGRDEPAPGRSAAYHRLRELTDQIHRLGRRLRLYEVPERSEAWTAAIAAGVDLVGTDRIESFQAFLRASRPELAWASDGHSR
jgi:hypothetical protein